MANRAVRISLASKCQLLFGAAVLLILSVALSVVWVGMQVLVREGQEETARKLASSWLNGKIELGSQLKSVDDALTLTDDDQGLTLTLIRKDEFDLATSKDAFLAEAIERFTRYNDRNELFRRAADTDGRWYYRYARALRRSDLARIQAGRPAGYTAGVEAPGMSDPLQMVLLLQLRADAAQNQLALNRIYIVAAGMVSGVLAIGVFWFITTRIILQPVRVLRDTAQKVSEGNLNIRSEISTGDEFEELAQTFNHMVDTLKGSQEKLHAINKSLDLKLVELARLNSALNEANKLKNEFLANVSHELRTPLNSIIGFAEVLEETLRERTGPVDDKRKRYAGNIILSSRRLLDLINDLLDLAKIEAGRMDLHPGPLSIADTVEGLVNLIRPQAEKAGVAVEVRVQPNIPVIETDAGKFQQVLFNFLSNALKFTPAGGTITVIADTLTMPPGPGTPATANAANAALPTAGSPVTAINPPQTAPPTEVSPFVRLAVCDTGPGVPVERHTHIFEKFTQLDTAVTKEHGGTGLGLAISIELTRLLQGRIEVQSNRGKGAAFCLVIPPKLESYSSPLMPDSNASPKA